MRIGFDGTVLANRRGFGRFARELLAALADVHMNHHIYVFVDEPSLAAGAVQVPVAFETVRVPVREAPSRAAGARSRRRLGDLLAMGRAVARARLDLMYFPATYGFFPVWGVPRVVVTVFDTIALAHPQLIFPGRLGRIAWTLKERAAVWRADRVLTVSHAAKRDILTHLRVNESKLRLVPCAPAPVFGPRPSGAASDAVLARYGIDPARRFLLYVGGLSPHKNLARLVESFAHAADAHTDLMLVGDLGDVFHTHVPELRAAVERHGLRDRVRFTGFVPDEELVDIYNRAYCLVQPSLIEGFGLPPVEALACGTPVLASTAGSLPEVIGAAGHYFDPLDVAGMARAIRSLLDDPAGRDALAERARERAAHFTWPAAARAVLAAWDEFGPRHASRRAGASAS
jgi:glycosyltransferase involved in cell wall biosynthesis